VSYVAWAICVILVIRIIWISWTTVVSAVNVSFKSLPHSRAGGDKLSGTTSLGCTHIFGAWAYLFPRRFRR